MRLEGKTKAGYYPTPPEVIDEMVNAIERGRITSPRYSSLLEPCCGDGRVGKAVKSKWQIYTAGIELNAKRCEEAKDHFDRICQADAFEFQAGGFDYLFLNPPYDDVKKTRLELLFLEHYIDALNPQGWLIYIIPEPNIEDSRDVLESNFKVKEIIRFPKKEYVAFKQVIVVAQPSDKKTRNPLPEVSDFKPLLPLPTSNTFSDPYLRRMYKPLKQEQIDNSGLWTSIWKESQPKAFEPASKIRTGHMALLLASGYLENAVVEYQNERYLIKGSTEKHTHKVIEDGELKERPDFVGKLYALNLNTGEYTVIE
jgi:hypothetical protein